MENRFLRLVCIIPMMLVAILCNAQQRIIDSLRKSLPHITNDSDRVINLSSTAFHYSSINSDSAFAISARALALARKINFDDGIASCDNTIGWIYFRKGQNEKAVKHIQSSIAMYVKTGNEEARFNSYFNLSSIFIRQGNYAEALKCLSTTLPLIDRYSTSPQTSGIYINLGIVYREMKEYEKAAEYFNKSIVLNLKSNNLQLAADTKISLGILYKQTKKEGAALREYEEAYALYKKAGNVYGMSIALENKGELFLESGEYDKAMLASTRALAGYEKLGSKSDIAFIHMNIAKVHAARSQYKEAILYLEKGLAMARETGSQNYVMDICQQMSDIYEKSGNYRSALQYYKEMQNVKDSLQSDAQQSALTNLRNTFEAKQKDKQIELLNADKLMQKQRFQKQFTQALMVILLISALATFWYIRISLLKKKNIIAEQEKQIVKREHTEVEQKLLRAQMNPHFIFNCLNTIDSFVLQNKQREASTLIQRFSKLARQVLEFTGQSSVSLEEEIGLIRVYLQIEQTRQQLKFDFSIDIDQQILCLRVPPMIIQPFIENAVVHGIKNRIGMGGEVSVLVEKEPGHIKFTIKDNGIGRQMARMIRSEQLPIHNSKAMEITNLRLQALHQQTGVDEYIKYTDYKGLKTGTKVEVYIPIIEKRTNNYVKSNHC